MRHRLYRCCHNVTVNTMANGNYGSIMNNFMGELSEPPGNTVSMTDLASAFLWHICLVARVWLTCSLWHIWMFNWIHYKELSGAENRFVNSFVWGRVQLFATAYSQNSRQLEPVWHCWCECVSISFFFFFFAFVLHYINLKKEHVGDYSNLWSNLYIHTNENCALGFFICFF